MTYDPIDTSATDNAADGKVTTDTVNSTTLDNSGTVTTQDLSVNGTASGDFGGGFPANFTYEDKSAVREAFTEFQNNSGSALLVAVTTERVGGAIFEFGISATVNGKTIQENIYRNNTGDIDNNAHASVTFFVPDGATYEIGGRGVRDATDWYEATV